MPDSQLDSKQIMQLAKFHIQDSEERGGFGLKSMESITVPVFTAATSSVNSDVLTFGKVSTY